MEDLELFYKKILESLKLLSMPFSEQKSFFPKFLDIPFEVIDTFDNVFLQLPKLVEEGFFSNTEIASLLRLNNMLNFTLSKSNFENLDEEQFSNHKDWNRIREMASETIKLIEKAKIK
jgi:hypothetical protein